MHNPQFPRCMGFNIGICRGRNLPRTRGHRLDGLVPGSAFVIAAGRNITGFALYEHHKGKIQRVSDSLFNHPRRILAVHLMCQVRTVDPESDHRPPWRSRRIINPQNPHPVIFTFVRRPGLVHIRIAEVRVKVVVFASPVSVDLIVGIKANNSGGPNACRGQIRPGTLNDVSHRYGDPLQNRRIELVKSE